MLEATTPDEIAKAKFMTAFYSGRKKPTNGHAYAARLLKAGIIDGEGWAIKEIADRIEGKAVQTVDLDHSGDVTLRVFYGSDGSGNSDQAS